MIDVIFVTIVVVAVLVSFLIYEFRKGFLCRPGSIWSSAWTFWEEGNPWTKDEESYRYFIILEVQDNWVKWTFCNRHGKLLSNQFAVQKLNDFLNAKSFVKSSY